MQAKVSAPQKKARNFRTGWQEQKVNKEKWSRTTSEFRKKKLQNFSSFLLTIKQRAMGFQNPVRKFAATYN
jgi:phage-related protein